MIQFTILFTDRKIPEHDKEIGRGESFMCTRREVAFLTYSTHQGLIFGGIATADQVSQLAYCLQCPQAINHRTIV